jgi:hypothetical protein
MLTLYGEESVTVVNKTVPIIAHMHAYTHSYTRTPTSEDTQINKGFKVPREFFYSVCYFVFDIR